MKHLAFTGLVIAQAAILNAQSVTVLPTSPATPATPTPLITTTLPAAPLTPGLPATGAGTSAQPGDQVALLPGFAPGAAVVFSVNDLAQNLFIAQAQLEQTLALLTTVNQNLTSLPAFTGQASANTGTSTAQPVSPVATTPIFPSAGANFSSAAGVNASSRVGQDLSMNLSVPAGGPPPMTLPPAMNTTPPVAANVAGASPSTVAPGALTFETVQALQLLQSQLERALPLLSAINASGVVPTLVSVAPQGFSATNFPGLPQQPIPTPTGYPSGRQPAPPTSLRVVPSHPR